MPSRISKQSHAHPNTQSHGIKNLGEQQNSQFPIMIRSEVALRLTKRWDAGGSDADKEEGGPTETRGDGIMDWCMTRSWGSLFS